MRVAYNRIGKTNGNPQIEGRGNESNKTRKTASCRIDSPHIHLDSGPDPCPGPTPWPRRIAWRIRLSWWLDFPVNKSLLQSRSEPRRELIARARGDRRPLQPSLLPLLSVCSFHQGSDHSFHASDPVDLPNRQQPARQLVVTEPRRHRFTNRQTSSRPRRCRPPRRQGDASSRSRAEVSPDPA